MPLKLPKTFYLGTDVVSIARGLLGKILVTYLNGNKTAGIIVETEAYSYKERGCHAYNNRRTERNKPMFEQGGISYVYLCYGVHEMFNVVTNKAGIAEAILVRALQPIDGIECMMRRMKAKSEKRITSGPGKLTKALGINRDLNAAKLNGKELWIEDRGLMIEEKKILASSRIGIDYAESDAHLPWRFSVKDNEWVSK